MSVPLLQITLLEPEGEDAQAFEQFKLLLDRFISIVDVVDLKKEFGIGGAKHLKEVHEPLNPIYAGVRPQLHPDILHSYSEPARHLLEQLRRPTQINKHLLIGADHMMVFHKHFTTNFAQAHKISEDMWPR